MLILFYHHSGNEQFLNPGQAPRIGMLTLVLLSQTPYDVLALFKQVFPSLVAQLYVIDQSLS